MWKNAKIGFWILVMAAALGTCGGGSADLQSGEETMKTLQIQSSAFEAESTIPQQYTCDGEDISPSLSWSEPPAGTQSLVLVCDDPDAPIGTWVHWVLFNIPATARSLPEGIPPEPVIVDIGVHGSNSWDRTAYGGPCPPQGTAHRYYFKLYALDANLALDAGAEKKQVEKAMDGHVLAEGQLMGRYGR